MHLALICKPCFAEPCKLERFNEFLCYFEFRVMPVGIYNASVTFKRMVDRILSGNEASLTAIIGSTFSNIQGNFSHHFAGEESIETISLALHGSNSPRLDGEFLCLALQTITYEIFLTFDFWPPNFRKRNRQRGPCTITRS